ncbi:MAG TPA: hypothetical protein VEA37_09970 [Flavobacterium sp.]|nr:hypothetical protein [Flavobacterium sp.]
MAKNKRILNSILALVILLAAAGAWLSLRDKNSSGIPSQNTYEDSKSDSMVGKGDVKTYTSNDLGITFNYLDTEAQPVKVARDGDRVYIAAGDQNIKKGQWVQVYKKDQNLTLAEAIQKDFLKEYSSVDCYVQIGDNSGMPSNYVVAHISYPHDAGSNEPWWTNNNCPKDYAETNGIRYFLHDKNYPDKYFFFSIGQYAIPGNETKTWQETFQVIK